MHISSLAVGCLVREVVMFHHRSVISSRTARAFSRSRCRSYSV